MPVKRARGRVRKPKVSRPHMPGYGIPKGKKGLLSWKWAEQRLEKSHNYWISTARPDGTPDFISVLARSRAKRETGRRIPDV